LEDMPRQGRLDGPGGFASCSVERFLGMTTSSVNRMTSQEQMAELDGWNKQFPFTPTSPAYF
jgi:hypothetical protein